MLECIIFGLGRRCDVLRPSRSDFKLVWGHMEFQLKRLLALALFVSVAACASPQELRQKIPDLDVVSSIPAERLAGCIGDRFEADGGNPNLRYYTRPTANGFSIAGEEHMNGIYGGGADTPVLVDLAKLDDGKVHVLMWSNYPFPAGTRKMLALVRSCL